MKILALDSSATVATVAVCDDGALLAEYTLNNGNTHSETLLPMVECVLGKLSMTVNDIDIFAASSGPGSFTGVRIGAATLKGLAFAQGKTCVGVSTLEALATNLSLYEGIVCPVMNARRSQVYTALFRSNGKAFRRGSFAFRSANAARPFPKASRPIRFRVPRRSLCSSCFDSIS